MFPQACHSCPQFADKEGRILKCLDKSDKDRNCRLESVCVCVDSVGAQYP